MINDGHKTYPVPAYSIWLDGEVAYRSIDFKYVCSLVESYFNTNQIVSLTKQTVMLNGKYYMWCNDCLEVECKECRLDYLECYQINKCTSMISGLSV
jgi:hypothetical protein